MRRRVRWVYITRAVTKKIRLGYQSYADWYRIYADGDYLAGYLSPLRSFWLRTKTLNLYFGYWPNEGGWSFASYYLGDRHYLWKGSRTKREREIGYLICSALNGACRGWNERELIQKMLNLNIEHFWARGKVR